MARTTRPGGPEGDDLPAGRFSTWLEGMEAALDGAAEADVPCGTCTACCESSQFVHIGPDEVGTLAHIDRSLLFPAPLMPFGHVLMGYDSHGRCPMLIDGGCSIYPHRPRTCRTYDCRVFPAADVVPTEPGKAAISQRARRWTFEHPTARDEALHAAVRDAATFVDEHRTDLGAELAPTTTTQLAVAAVEAHRVFLDGRPSVHEVRVELSARRTPR